MVAKQWRAHSRHSLVLIASSPANAPRHIADLMTHPKPRCSVTLRAANDCGLRHGSGQHCECPSSPRAQGKARSRDCACVCAYAYVGTSVEPSGFDNARLATLTNSLSASQATPIPRFALCSGNRKSPFTAPSAYSPRIVSHALRITAHRQRNRCRVQKSFRGLHDFSHATSVLPHIALVHIPRGQKGSESKCREGGGGYLRAHRGQAPEPRKSLI